MRWNGAAVQEISSGLGATTGLAPFDLTAADLTGIVWRNASTGGVELWNLNSPGGGFSYDALNPVNTNWQIAGTGDFTGTGDGGILWRNTSNGAVELWNQNGQGGFSYQALNPVNLNWQIEGTGDFTGSGEDSILWSNTSTGGVELWNPNGSGGFSYQALNPVNTNWQIQGTGDFNGAGEDGILWRNASTGGVELWNSNGSGGFTLSGLGACQHQLADCGNRRFHRERRRRHPVAERVDRRRRALEPEWLGRLQLRKPEPGQHGLAYRRHGRLQRKRRGRHPVAERVEWGCRALELQWLRRLHLREPGFRQHPLVSPEGLGLSRAHPPFRAPGDARGAGWRQRPASPGSRRARRAAIGPSFRLAAQPPAEQASEPGAARLTTKNGDVGVAPDSFDRFKLPRFPKTTAQRLIKKQHGIAADGFTLLFIA